MLLICLVVFDKNAFGAENVFQAINRKPAPDSQRHRVEFPGQINNGLFVFFRRIDRFSQNGVSIL